MTLTTFDESLCKILEPNVSTTKERFEVLKIMRDNHIPTVVWLCPFLPFINDNEENLRGLLNYCIEAKVYGIMFWGIGLTLREGNREYYYQKLDELYPGLKEKYIQKYGNEYVVKSDNGERLHKMVMDMCKKNGIVCNNEKLFEYLRTFEEKNKTEQLSLF
jgi:DNA repair photolyase